VEVKGSGYDEVFIDSLTWSLSPKESIVAFLMSVSGFTSNSVHSGEILRTNYKPKTHTNGST